MRDDTSMRHRIEQHLPHLRRYSRALTGSQQAGDERVRALLQALVDGKAALPAGGDTRQGLFALFHADQPLPHPDRQALLLTVVEGFSVDQAAQILSQAPDAAGQAIGAARTAIAEMIKSDVLIIEDEQLIAMELEQMMTDMGHGVVGIAVTEERAVAAAAANRPDLVLADVQLADGSSGIDAARRIVAAHDIPVIFITAFPERLFTGQPQEPAFVVAKPFDPDAVIATVGQALLARLPDFAPVP